MAMFEISHGLRLAHGGAGAAQAWIEGARDQQCPAGFGADAFVV